MAPSPCRRRRGTCARPATWSSTSRCWCCSPASPSVGSSATRAPCWCSRAPASPTPSVSTTPSSRVGWSRRPGWRRSASPWSSSGPATSQTAPPDRLAFSCFCTPTTVSTPTGFESDYPAPLAPGVTLLAYRGDLGLDSGIPQSVYTLDTQRLQPVSSQFLRPGETMALPGGGSLRFTGLTEWATFQVTSDPGRSTALVASIGIVVGLLLSLRVRRRRLWMRATPAGGLSADAATVVELGGLARSDAATFATEFAALAGELEAERVCADSSDDVPMPAAGSKE